MRVRAIRLDTDFSEKAEKKQVSQNAVWEVKIERQRVTKKKVSMTLFFYAFSDKIAFLEKLAEKFPDIKVALDSETPTKIYNGVQAALRDVTLQFTEEE